MARFFCHVDGVAMQFRLERNVRPSASTRTSAASCETNRVGSTCMTVRSTAPAVPESFDTADELALRSCSCRNIHLFPGNSLRAAITLWRLPYQHCCSFLPNLHHIFSPSLRFYESNPHPSGVCPFLPLPSTPY